LPIFEIIRKKLMYKLRPLGTYLAPECARLSKVVVVARIVSAAICICNELSYRIRTYDYCNAELLYLATSPEIANGRSRAAGVSRGPLKLFGW